MKLSPLLSPGGRLENRLVAKSHFRLVAHDLPVVRGCAATQPHQSGMTFGKLYGPAANSLKSVAIHVHPWFKEFVASPP